MCPSDSPSRSTDIILLAAGRGRRLGMAGHKALLPVRHGRGTLPLLLESLTRLPVGRIHLVTGHEHAAVEAAARAIVPDVHLLHNPDPAGTEMLQSLAIALARRPARDVWVLAADTLYAPEALARLLAVPAGRSAIAVAPSLAQTRREIGVQVAGGRVQALGPDLPEAAHRMAHAVRWPAGWHEAVIAAAGEGLRFQWQVLARMLRAGSAAPAIFAVPVAADAATDLDTPDDLIALRSRSAGSPPADRHEARG